MIEATLLNTLITACLGYLLAMFIYNIPKLYRRAGRWYRTYKLMKTLDEFDRFLDSITREHDKKDKK